MPRILSRLLCAVFCTALLLACSGEERLYDSRELTPEEQKKAHLDEAFSEFVSALGVSSEEDLKAFVQNFGYADFSLDEGLHLSLKKYEESYLDIYLLPTREGLSVKMSLYGGLSLKGTVNSPSSPDVSGWPDFPGEYTFSALVSWLGDVVDALKELSASTLDGMCALKLYDDGIYAARLGFTLLDTVVPVFRFDDGTSYTADSLVLTGDIVGIFISGL